MAAKPTVQEALLLLAKTVPAGEAGYPIESLCRELEVDRAGLMRLTDMIGRCGVPPYAPSDIVSVWVDDDDRLHVDFADYLSGPARLSVDEVLALRLAVRWCQAQRMPWLEAANELFRKLERMLEEAEREEADASEKQVMPTFLERPPEYLEALAEAARLCRVVTFVYYSLHRDACEPRRVLPMTVFHSGEAWYLKACLPEGGAVRRFHLGRMQDVRVLEEEFDPAQLPAEEPAEGPFDWPAASLQARVRFAPDCAVAAREIAGQESVEDTPDGGVVLTVPVYGPAYVRSLVLGFGEGAEVLDPPDLRRHLRDYLDRYLAAMPPCQTGP